jgi:hypothetical protein
LLVGLPIAAQLQVGETSSRLSGIISPGYTADFSNVSGSDHSWTIGGTLNYSGSFHNPNFLSFDASLFLNQSRANSDYQSISNASGGTGSATFFGGSHFPGTISYSKAYNAEGNYAVPGIANYVTHGNNDSFNVNWNENLPDAPSFSVGFQKGASKYSVYGTDDQGTTGYHSLSLHSGYTLAGFSMGGYYSDGTGDSLIPEVISGAADTDSKSNNSNYGFNLTHKLPLHGAASAAMAHSAWDSSYEGTSSTGSIDLFNAAASLHPFTKVAFSGSASYSDNLAGQLVEAVIASGGVATAVTPGNGNKFAGPHGPAQLCTAQEPGLHGLRGTEIADLQWNGLRIGHTGCQPLLCSTALQRKLQCLSEFGRKLLKHHWRRFPELHHHGELHQRDQGMENGRVICLFAKRRDSAGHLHELLLPVLRQRAPALGSVQREHGSGRWSHCAHIGGRDSQ